MTDAGADGEGSLDEGGSDGLIKWDSAARQQRGSNSSSHTRRRHEIT